MKKYQIFKLFSIRLLLIAVALTIVYSYSSACSIGMVNPITGGTAGEQISLLGSFAMTGSTTPILKVGSYECSITSYGITSISAIINSKVPSGNYKITVTDKSGSQCTYPSYSITGGGSSGSCAVSGVFPATGVCAGGEISILGVFALNGSNTPEVYVGSYKCTVSNYSIASMKVIVNPAVPGGSTYKITVRDKSGAECTYPSISVKGMPKPPSSLAANPPIAYCGDEVGITVIGGLIAVGSTNNYEGSCGGNLIGNHPVTFYVKPTKTTTYFVSNSNECGESECISLTLTVKDPLPPSKLTAFPTSVKCGQTSRITITGGKENACYNYEDSCGGKLIGNSSVNFIVKPMKTTTYYVQNGVEGASECGLSACLSVTVNVTCDNNAVDSPENDNTFSIYSSEKTLYVNYNNFSNEPAVINISNLMGQSVISDNTILNGKYQYMLNVPPGFYLVKANVDSKMYVRKVFIQ